MCYDVQNFDLSKGKSSFLELFHVIFILFTITKILYYHQGIFLYIEACVKTKKLKNQNYFKRPSQQLCKGCLAKAAGTYGDVEKRLHQVLRIFISFVREFLKIVHNFIELEEESRLHKVPFRRLCNVW